MALHFPNMPPASSIFAAYASLTAFIMLIQTILNQIVPRHLQHHLWSSIQSYLKPKTKDSTIIIEQKDGMSDNQIYDAAEIYLGTKLRSNIERLKITKRLKDHAVTVKFAQSERIVDTFQGIDLEWRFVKESRQNTSKLIEDNDSVLFESKHYFEISFDKNHKEKVLDAYVPFVLDKARLIMEEKKLVKLHTLACAASYGYRIAWDSINLEHPSTFDTLAMDGGLKRSIIDDLDRFVRRKEFYKRVGRAWKRGYLLYGPPGTGKSSLIAAMANYLKFDIYDLELANVKKDSDLRTVLLRTANRSILVIEDVDCTVKLPERDAVDNRHAGNGNSSCTQEQFTLSGLLNFIDGLWSSCGDERIIIFTTNNKDKLDPALLRPGRMDMHIHMSYLTLDGFRLLAKTYLNIHDQHHPRILEIEDLIRGMELTPAEIAEELMKSEDAEASLDGLVEFLKGEKMNRKGKKKENGIHGDRNGEEQMVTDVTSEENESRLPTEEVILNLQCMDMSVLTII